MKYWGVEKEKRGIFLLGGVGETKKSYWSKEKEKRITRVVGERWVREKFTS
jgi:hypothetical protein